MSILFRCPCGRSMVVESDRAGAQVTCPNCRRTLKVPSGKDRGVELASAPAATKTRTSRSCPRCRKEVPVDTQACPYCKAVLTAAGAAAPAAAAVAVARPAQPARKAPVVAGIVDAGTEIRLGGSHDTWWSGMSTGGKVGVLAGVFAFVIVVGFLIYFLYTNWTAGQLTEGRSVAQKAVEQGRKNELLGKFQEAYDKYDESLRYEEFLNKSPQATDKTMVETIKARKKAMEYLVQDPKVRDSVYWKPQSQQEYDEAMTKLRSSYPVYKEWILAVAGFAKEAMQTGRANPPNQQAYEERLGQTFDAYVKFIAQTDDYQRAQTTFQQLIKILQSLADADRNWGTKQRDQFLNNTEGYLGGMTDVVSSPGYPDALWQR